MQLETITTCCTHVADMRSLQRAGGAVLEGCERIPGSQQRRLFWRVRLPAVTALRMGLVALGSELSEVVDASAIADLMLSRKGD